MISTREKRFILYEILVEGSTEKHNMGTYDTYEEACDAVDKFPKSRIPLCSIMDRGIEFKL